MNKFTNWYTLAKEYERSLLAIAAKRYDFYGVEEMFREAASSGDNYIVLWLRDDPKSFVEIASRLNGKDQPNLDGCCRAAALMQMYIYDRIGGPDSTFKGRGIRRHWYAYFKQFSQYLAFATGKTKTGQMGVAEMNDIQWSGRLSQIYAGWVQSKRVTYQDLWVEDSSRMYRVFSEPLYPTLRVILAVEKDSQFDDFEGVARALGASALISGKGKQSAAATEKMLRELGWGSPYNSNPFPDGIVVISVSDYDTDGEQVIAPTHAEQMRRYVDDVKEIRVGITPLQVHTNSEGNLDEVWNKSYQLKLSNSSYREWADLKAIFLATCSECGNRQPVMGTDMKEFLEYASLACCTRCGSSLNIEKDDYDVPHGYEVEALNMVEQHRDLVHALLQRVSWDKIVDELRKLAIPDPYSVTGVLVGKIAQQNVDMDKVQRIISILEDQIHSAEMKLRDLASGDVSDALSDMHHILVSEGGDPTVEEFNRYVMNNSGSRWVSAWRPFNIGDRQQLALDLIEMNYPDIEANMKSAQLLDFDKLKSEIESILSE
jgi:hypothetical protein